MQAVDRRRLSVLLVLQLLWGLVLWFSISKLGLGLSTDSVPMLFGGTNLAAGRGLLSFDGSPVILWPPLYPALLAAVHVLTGLGTFAAAHVLQVISFLGVSLSLSLLFLRIFPDDFPFAVSGAVLSNIGLVVVAGFGMVGSDYLHLFLVLLCALLVALYVEQPSGRLYVAMFVAAMLATLERYLGLAAISMAALSTLLWSTGSPGQRLVRSGFLLLAALPSAVWLLLASPLVSHRPPATFGKNFGWFSNAVLGWFLSSDAIQAHPVFYITLLWIAIALVAFALWVARRSLPRFSVSILLFGLLYTLALFGSAAVSYYNRLEGRFLLPLYIPSVVGLLLAMKIALAALRRTWPARYAVGRLAAFGALGLLAVLLLSVTLPSVIASHSGISGPADNVFNDLSWRSNDALHYWQSHRPAGSYVLLSNQPDGVAFYTGHACDASPRRRLGPYGPDEFPVDAYASTLFGSGQPVYIVWIEPNDLDYYYKPEDLAPIAEVEQLYSGSGGAVFRLTPKPGGWRGPLAPCP